jgi:hypothetical protein
VRTRGSSTAERLVHNQEVGGASPSPAPTANPRGEPKRSRQGGQPLYVYIAADAPDPLAESDEDRRKAGKAVALEMRVRDRGHYAIFPRLWFYLDIAALSSEDPLIRDELPCGVYPGDDYYRALCLRLLRACDAVFCPQYCPKVKDELSEASLLGIPVYFSLDQIPRSRYAQR